MDGTAWDAEQTAPSVIDLCSGCGGLSLGVEMAGFHAPVAFEIDDCAADTYEANHPGTRMIRGDIRGIGSWAQVAADAGCRIDGVIGGCPCQGFALCGRRDPKDPRNSLFMDFARCVSEIRPAFFVMENVPGILSMRTASGDSVSEVILSVFGASGYRVAPRIVNAAECGVPQARKRIFFVGFRNDVPTLGDWDAFLPHAPAVTVDMAIFDLPPIASGEGSEEQGYAMPPQNHYQEWARTGSTSVRNHISMRHTRRLVDRFKAILPGQSVADVPLEHSAVKRGDPKVKSGKIYGQNNMRVHGDRPSPTVAASFQSNFIHPRLDRNFTAREGARLQSFPDWYVFLGKRTKMSWEKGLSQYQQIGNAVPPLLAKSVAIAVLRALGIRGGSTGEHDAPVHRVTPPREQSHPAVTVSV